MFHWLTSFGGQTWGTKLLMKISEVTNYTLEDDPMVEENTLPGGQDVRVYVSFRECILALQICNGGQDPPPSLPLGDAHELLG